MDPIFIIGTERSGTNLLRLMLNSHSAIAVPHPPHIMRLFGPLAPWYGDLTIDRNFRKLISDVCRMVELHPYSWDLVLDREQVLQQARDRSLISIYFAVYDQYLAASGKERWACKSTFMIEQVAEVLLRYPDARFLFMVRDGRDVAVSARSSIFNHYHVYYSAQRWAREQRLGLSWLTRLPREQIMLLRYKELIREPEGTLRTLCGFLDEPFEQAMLAFHRTREAQKSAGLSISWENTNLPVISTNTGKYKDLLCDKDILLFEAIAYNELQELGYSLDNPLDRLEAMHAEAMRPRLAYWLSDQVLSVKAEIAHLFRDASSWKRIKKAAFMRSLACIRRVR